MNMLRTEAFKCFTTAFFLLFIYCFHTTNAQSSDSPSFSTITTSMSPAAPSNSLSTISASTTVPSNSSTATSSTSTTASATSSSVYPVWGPNESNNCKGSGVCGLPSFNAQDCREAAELYDNNTIYYKPTSFYQNDHSSIGGCTAMYKCVAETDFGVGLTGKELKEAFAIIYKQGKGPGYGNCRKCGSHTLANTRCWVTFNYCKSCSDTNGGEGVPLPDVCPPLAINNTRFLPWPTNIQSGGSDPQGHAQALWPSINWSFYPNVTRSAYYDSTSTNPNFAMSSTQAGAAASTQVSTQSPGVTPSNMRVLSSPS